MASHLFNFLTPLLPVNRSSKSWNQCQSVTSARSHISRSLSTHKRRINITPIKAPRCCNPILYLIGHQSRHIRMVQCHRYPECHLLYMVNRNITTIYNRWVKLCHPHPNPYRQPKVKRNRRLRSRITHQHIYLGLLIPSQQSHHLPSLPPPQIWLETLRPITIPPWWTLIQFPNH